MKKIKVIGFNQGQYGDLCMCTVAARAIKESLPDCVLYFGINKKYQDIQDIFLYNRYIDHIHIWDQYNSWPSNIDIDYINNEKFDIVFNPMPNHTIDNWYLYRHQTQELCLMHGIQPPDDLQVYLNQYFNISRNKKYIAVNLFAETRSNDKIPNINQAINICKQIQLLGLTPVQIGLAKDPQICDNRFIGSFIDSIKFTLSCDLLLTVDSAMNWIMSGYNFPVLGLYSYNYYPGSQNSKNWQPINPNAQYLESYSIDSIPNDDIINTIRKML